MNCLSPSTVIPLLRTPLTVGKRGSSLQQKTAVCQNTTKKFQRLKAKILSNSPSFNVSLLHKPGKLPLREHGVVEVEPGVLPDVRLPDAQGVDDPVELVVAIVILCGPESVGHALQTVHYGTGKVVRWVDSGGKGVAEGYIALCILNSGRKKTQTGKKALSMRLVWQRKLIEWEEKYCCSEYGISIKNQ